MNTDTLVYQLALTMIPDIGAITAKKLIGYVGSPEGVFREKAVTLRAIPGIGAYLASQVSSRDFISEARLELEQMSKRGISAMYYLDPDYPWRLKNCDDSPILLFYRGNTNLNRTRILSVVGTRNVTQHGKETCRKLISDLSAKYPDLIIVSGLAYGVDITAHRSALDTALDTVAVLAHGLSTIYPSLHRDTASRILSQGALLTDFHTMTKPERNNFLRRNRIIAGLAEATVVIESGEKGGALITAEMASSYSREVFAIPGRPEDPFSKGCNKLIKNNIAALVECASDIETLLNWESIAPSITPLSRLNIILSEPERRILETLTDTPGLSQEILSIRSGIALPKLISLLLQMELQNWVTLLPGNIYKAAVKI